MSAIVGRTVQSPLSYVDLSRFPYLYHNGNDRTIKIEPFQNTYGVGLMPFSFLAYLERVRQVGFLFLGFPDLVLGDTAVVFREDRALQLPTINALEKLNC